MRSRITVIGMTLGFAFLLSMGQAASAAITAGLGPGASVESEYKRLKAIAARLKKIPMEKQDREPNKSYLRRNRKDIVYSDPSGEWYVRADRYWNLAKRNSRLPIADDIAWTAANTPLPGECEGDMNCYLYYTQETVGQYLKLFPNGKYSRAALTDLVSSISAFTAPDAGAGYEVPSDASAKAELQKTVADLRRTVAKVSGWQKDKALAELNKLADKYR